MCQGERGNGERKEMADALFVLGAKWHSNWAVRINLERRRERWGDVGGGG